MATFSPFFSIIIPVLLFVQSSAWQCDFEKDSCDMLDHVVKGPSEEFQWVRNRRWTRTELTGPYFAHGGEWYIYTEATGRTFKEHDVARAYLPPVDTTGHYCLTFWFSMYGKDMGSLHVSLTDGKDRKEVFGYGEVLPKPTWYSYNVTFAMNAGDRIVLEGEHGGGNAGDMAVDDIKFNPC